MDPFTFIIVLLAVTVSIVAVLLTTHDEHRIDRLDIVTDAHGDYIHDLSITNQYQEARILALVDWLDGTESPVYRGLVQRHLDELQSVREVQ